MLGNRRRIEKGDFISIPFGSWNERVVLLDRLVAALDFNRFHDLRLALVAHHAWYTSRHASRHLGWLAIDEKLHSLFDSFID